MGTITSLMDIAQQALMADQEALSVTGNNVANQNTPGYTREVVSFQTIDAVTLSGGSFGSGVTATETSQRDRVLEQQVQQQTQTQKETRWQRLAPRPASLALPKLGSSPARQEPHWRVTNNWELVA